MRVMFLGGPGNISESTISYFLEKDTPVAVIKRTQGGLLGLEGKIRVYYGDRNQLEVLDHALVDFKPDTVIDCTCFETEQAETVIRAAQNNSFDRLVFVSTADVYGYPLTNLPMREDDPWN